jgi:hypothetical protein
MIDGVQVLAGGAQSSVRHQILFQERISFRRGHFLCPTAQYSHAPLGISRLYKSAHFYLIILAAKISASVKRLSQDVVIAVAGVVCIASVG